jgi:hypothetical protein
VEYIKEFVAQTNRKNEHKYRKQMKQIGRTARHHNCGATGSTIVFFVNYIILNNVDVFSSVTCLKILASNNQ